MAAGSPRDAAQYETLRGDALRDGFGEGSVLLPHGLAVWLTAVSPVSRQVLSPAPPSPAGAACPRFLPATLASIVLRLTREEAHA